jgi:hypothetical protein
VLGGSLRPVRPIGPAQALELAEAAPPVAFGQASVSVEIARVRQARQICPVDTLEQLDAFQWQMVAALNDLLQCTSPLLGGALSKRPSKLLQKVQEMMDGVPPVGSVREALARHATFARVLLIQRIDTGVSWWCGSTEFRGLPPPRRLFAWSKIRRVRSERLVVPIAALTRGSPLGEDEYQATLANLLRLSPLTDLATAGRQTPPFAWSSSTLSLLYTEPARVVALRALRLGRLRDVVGVIEKASTPDRLAEVYQRPVRSVLEELGGYEDEAGRSSVTR